MIGRTYSLARVSVCPSAPKNCSSGRSKKTMIIHAITARMMEPMMETVKYSLDWRVGYPLYLESC